MYECGSSIRKNRCIWHALLMLALSIRSSPNHHAHSAVRLLSVQHAQIATKSAAPPTICRSTLLVLSTVMIAAWGPRKITYAVATQALMQRWAAGSSFVANIMPQVGVSSLAVFPLRRARAPVLPQAAGPHPRHQAAVGLLHHQSRRMNHPYHPSPR